jgi:Bacterial PH domain
LIYNVLDWANDFLVLTNFRVIHIDTQLLVRDVKQEIVIDNIRQVDNRADSYIAYWLGYLRRGIERFGSWLGLRNPPQGPVAAVFSTLVVRSFSVRTLTFGYAADGYVMERMILAELSKLRRQQEPELLRRLIEDRVYSDKPPPKPSPAIHVEERPGPIPWFFPPNPEIKGDTITWRPYWIFLALAMLRPLAILVLVSAGAVLALRLGFLTPGLAFVLWLPIALFCIGWVIWIREEHEHDKYILNRQNIIDVDKRPFGPESSARGPLSAIQDIVFDVNFIESLLGYGDVIIDTGGGGKFTFRHVPDPRGVQATINDYLTDFKKGERERQLTDMLALLKQYHSVQGEHGELIDKDQLAALINEKVSAQLAQPQTAAAQAESAREAARGELIRLLRLRRLGRRRI